MLQEPSRYEVQVAYIYYVCYTDTAKSNADAIQHIRDGDGDAISNIPQPGERLPTEYWKVRKITRSTI